MNDILFLSKYIEILKFDYFIYSKYINQKRNLKMEEYFKKVKNYLFDLGFTLQTEDEAESLVVITDEDKGISNLLIDCEDDILILEQFIFSLQEVDAKILQRLLQINRTIVHGALVLDDEGERVIFRDTLQLENLDRNELEASINSISLMMAEYAGEFISFAGKGKS